MEIAGVLGSIHFDGTWITIVKKPAGQRATESRIRAADVSAIHARAATRLFHGYVQFVVPGGIPAPVAAGAGGRPPYSDPHSLSLPYRSNEGAEELIRAVEAARSS